MITEALMMILNLVVIVSGNISFSRNYFCWLLSAPFLLPRQARLIQSIQITITIDNDYYNNSYSNNYNKPTRGAV